MPDVAEKPESKVKKAASENLVRFRNAVVNVFNKTLESTKGAPKNVARIHFKGREGMDPKSYEKLKEKELANLKELLAGKIRLLKRIEDNWPKMIKKNEEITKMLHTMGPNSDKDVFDKEIDFCVSGTGVVKQKIEVHEEGMEFHVPFVDRLRYANGYVEEIQTFGYNTLDHFWLPQIEKDVNNICDRAKSKYIKEKLIEIREALQGELGRIRD